MRDAKKLYKVVILLKNNTKIQLFDDNCNHVLKSDGRIKFEGYTDVSKKKIKNVVVHDEDVLVITTEENNDES